MKLPYGPLRSFCETFCVANFRITANRCKRFFLATLTSGYLSDCRGGEEWINMRLIKYATATILAGALVSAAAASSAYAQYYYGPGYSTPTCMSQATLT